MAAAIVIIRMAIKNPHPKHHVEQVFRGEIVEP